MNMEPEDLYDLMLGAGFKEPNAKAARKIVKALYEGGLMRQHVWSDGLGYQIRTALHTLAYTRKHLPIQVGHRVVIQNSAFEDQVKRWKQRGDEEIRATFSEVGTVTEVYFSDHSDGWIATVMFDKEYYSHYHTKELIEVTNRHTWAFHMDDLRMVS